MQIYDPNLRFKCSKCKLFLPKDKFIEFNAKKPCAACNEKLAKKEKIEEA